MPAMVLGINHELLIPPSTQMFWPLTIKQKKAKSKYRPLRCNINRFYCLMLYNILYR